MPAESVALPIIPPPAPPPIILLAIPLAIDMLTIAGFVALPTAHEGTGTAERVTTMLAGGPVGHAGVIEIMEVAFCLLSIRKGGKRVSVEG